MNQTADFTKLMPGFDFLQNMMKNAGAAMPAVGQWVTPTIDPAELEKRINELRTVQFWLEQNARMLATTIQALEVQRMTLSTLKNMNVRMTDLREALTIRRPETPAAGAAAAAPAAEAKEAAPPAEEGAAAPAAAGAVDPMQWWGALTRQFTELATNALKETAAAATQAGATVAAAASAAGAKAAGTPATEAPAPAPAPRKRTAARRRGAQPPGE